MAYTGLRVKGQSSPEEVACGVFVGLGVCPRAWQRNSAWVTRFSGAACPHFSQRSELCPGSTSIQVPDFYHCCGFRGAVGP